MRPLGAQRLGQRGRAVPAPTRRLPRSATAQAGRTRRCHVSTSALARRWRAHYPLAAVVEHVVLIDEEDARPGHRREARRAPRRRSCTARSRCSPSTQRANCCCSGARWQVPLRWAVDELRVRASAPGRADRRRRAPAPGRGARDRLWRTRARGRLRYRAEILDLVENELDHLFVTTVAGDAGAGPGRGGGVEVRRPRRARRVDRRRAGGVHGVVPPGVGDRYRSSSLRTTPDSRRGVALGAIIVSSPARRSRSRSAFLGVEQREQADREQQDGERDRPRRTTTARERQLGRRAADDPEAP